MHAEISTDGRVDDEGEGTWAFVAKAPGRKATGRGTRRPCASHVAEWLAVEAALSWVDRHLAKGDSFTLRTDSALVAKGLASRLPAMSGEAAEIRAAARRKLASLAKRGITAEIVRVGREENREADRASRNARTKRR